jgi:hypothetical protein
MIDFRNASFVKLHPAPNGAFTEHIQAMLIPGEQAIGTFQALRDGVVFTTKRIISINVQGVTGKKKDFTSLPYSKIQAFSIETAGALDLDSELELYFTGLGVVRFEFEGSVDIFGICRIISENIL